MAPAETTSPREGGPEATEGGRGLLPALAAALLLGGALRVVEAVSTSLWLDELHTLSHSSRATLEEVASAVSQDNHTPLFFYVIHIFGDFASGPWLRWIPIVASLAVLPMILRLTRESPRSARTGVLALWLFACLPYQVHYGAELRPYAFLGLLSAAACWAAFAVDGSKVLRFAIFALAVFLGLWTHRLMALGVFSIGVARLFVRDARLLGLPALILAGVLAVLPEVPWLLSFGRTSGEVRHEHEAQTGGRRLRPALAKEVVVLPARLAVPVIGFLGSPWSTGARVGTAVLFLGATVSFAAWVLARRRGRAPPMSVTVRGILIFAVFDFLAISALSLFVWDRVPLQYYTGVAWALPLFLAEWACVLPDERLRRAVVGCLGAGALIAGASLAFGSSRENMQGAVELVREWEVELRDVAHRPPITTALLAQPGEVFGNLLPYQTYAQDLEAVEPADLPRPGQEGFERPVLVIRRVLSLEHYKWKPILEGREIVREQALDRYITVYEFGPAE